MQEKPNQQQRISSSSFTQKGGGEALRCVGGSGGGGEKGSAQIIYLEMEHISFPTVSRAPAEAFVMLPLFHC